MPGRIVFDLDGTLVGFRSKGDQEVLALNTALVRVAQRRRAQGHTIILWTFGNREWWRHVRKQFPVLRTLFHEVYTRDELPGRITASGGRPEKVKDIRVVQGDVLIDNEPAHHAWAKRHGLASRYVQVPTFGIA